MIHRSQIAVLATGAAALILAAQPAAAQLGRQQTLVEPNVAADSTLAALPGLNADIATALRGARPILSAVSLDSILASKALSKAARTTLYSKLFVHVDINRGTDTEFMLIPGMDAKKLTAIKANRPFTTFDKYTAEMTKAANAAESRANGSPRLLPRPM